MNILQLLCESAPCANEFSENVQWRPAHVEVISANFQFQRMAMKREFFLCQSHAPGTISESGNDSNPICGWLFRYHRISASFDYSFSIFTSRLERRLDSSLKNRINFLHDCFTCRKYPNEMITIHVRVYWLLSSYPTEFREQFCKHEHTFGWASETFSNNFQLQWLAPISFRLANFEYFRNFSLIVGR